MSQTPAVPCNIRGNLIRVQAWKGGSDYTKSELRYDQVGNVAQAISHATSNAAETTFTYYDRLNDSLYAYPWRVVNHVATSVCSLYTKTEYDSATGLIKKTFDANTDSTVFAYDSLNRIRKIWQPNEADPSVIKRYYKDDPTNSKPASVIDSVKLDTLWLESKSFLDGFSQVIQTKKYKPDTTIIQNITYDGNGLKDSIGNPYTVTGTISYDYTTPSWIDITYFEYDRVGRDTPVAHPDTKKIRIKYHAYADTVYDEKNNKTIYSKNAFGLIDTLTDASGNKTYYQYDKLHNLTQITDAESRLTKYYYDKLSRLRGIDSPDASSDWTYDGNSVDVLYIRNGVKSQHYNKPLTLIVM
jgi:YD repeat-containing protein